MIYYQMGFNTVFSGLAWFAAMDSTEVPITTTLLICAWFCLNLLVVMKWLFTGSFK